MLLSKEVKAKWNSKNKKWYETKGYIYTKLYDEFIVKVDDLSSNSKFLVDVKCDCEDCKNPYLKPMQWANYLRYIKKDNKYYCNGCSKKLFSKKRIKQVKIIKINKTFEQWCIENNRQDVLDRWDYELNNKKPNEISYGTTKKYYFKCSRDIHNSELKKINSFTNGQEGSVRCNQCNSFQQWCYDNLSKEKADEILSRWDYELNKCSPLEVSYGSEGKNKEGYWFKCNKCKEHKSELKNINHFTTRKGGELDCKQCGSFAQYLINTYGDNALELYWDWNKNTINPWIIEKCCSKNVWIKCQNVDKSYHGSYEVICTSFYTMNSRCPYCNGKKVHPLDSLGRLLENKNLLNLWSDKNEKSPYNYAPNSRKEVWWKCADGKHEDYKGKISDRYSCDFRCPKCVQERTESLLQEKIRLYLESLRYITLHERKCTLNCINPKTQYLLPYDNEIKELKLIIEVHGEQHYKISSWHKGLAKKRNTTPEYEIHMLKVRDRYKRIYAKSQGYEYLEIPYWTDDKNDTWKQLIDNKLLELKL